jgi:hypothetical protein
MRRRIRRNGLSDFQSPIANNPGVSLNVFRSLPRNLGALPLLMRDSSRLTPASFPSTPSFPYTEVVDGDITIFSPELHVPRAETWQAGVTRAIGRSIAVEARYVGAHSSGNWRTGNNATNLNNYNELNINNVNFVPVSGMVNGVTTANTNNRANGANPDDHDVTTLVNGNALAPRIVQLVGVSAGRD